MTVGAFAHCERVEALDKNKKALQATMLGLQTFEITIVETDIGHFDKYLAIFRLGCIDVILFELVDSILGTGPSLRLLR